MLNDAQYKSCLTLILASKSHPSHEQRPNCIDGVNDTSTDMSPDHNRISSSVEMNLSQLSQKMNRTFIRGDSFNQSFDSNETINPIKCLSRDESSDCESNIITPTETSPKYCCTLEVKFVWYECDWWNNHAHTHTHTFLTFQPFGNWNLIRIFSYCHKMFGYFTILKRKIFEMFFFLSILVSFAGMNCPKIY